MRQGQRLAGLAELEEGLGLRSSFNFVPERYRVDPALLSALRQRGFEIGVHGLKHDGQLFSSQRSFTRQAAKINSTCMHGPRWAFVLPTPTGIRTGCKRLTSSMICHSLTAIPTTYAWRRHDHLAFPTRIVCGTTVYARAGSHAYGHFGCVLALFWLDKVDFVERSRGMALVNAHPDYLRDPKRLALYEAFLRAMTEKDNYWHALPREVARWWKRRAQIRAGMARWTVGPLRPTRCDFSSYVTLAAVMCSRTYASHFTS